MKKLHEKIVALKNKEATQAFIAVEQRQAEDSLIELGMGIGAIRTLNAIVTAASSKAIHTLQIIRDNRLYEQVGFTRFDDFLDQSPHSPMNYAKFNRYEKTLEAEGEVAFDTLNAMGVPLSTRKLLSSGSVKVEADEIVVGEERARLDDPARITEIIRSLATKSAEQTRTIERGKADVLKLKKKVDQAKKSGSSFPSSFDQALLNLLGAFTLLLNEAEQLPAHELNEKKPYTLQQIAQQRRRLEEGFGLKPPPLTDKERAAGLDAVIDELDDEM